MTQSSEKETLPDFRIALELLHQLVNLNKTDELLADSKIKAYFLDDFIPEAAKSLLINKGYNIPECLILSNQIIIEAMNLFNKLMMKEDVAKMSEMFKNILEPAKAYYKLNN